MILRWIACICPLTKYFDGSAHLRVLRSGQPDELGPRVSRQVTVRHALVHARGARNETLLVPTHNPGLAGIHTWVEHEGVETLGVTVPVVTVCGGLTRWVFS